MESLWPQIEQLLPNVTKPARYIGGEQGALAPEHGPGRVAWLLVYPDTYEIGLPNQGLQILYEILNERPDALAERSYAPWVDMEAAMRPAGVPLFSVEQHLPAAAFDVLAFNLSAELVYTNVLNLIDLAGVPLHAADRSAEDLLVVAGGHCAYNPEPLADFVDAFVLGDGEEVVGEVNDVLAAWHATGPEGRDRQTLLRAWLASRGSTSLRSTSPATRGAAWWPPFRPSRACRAEVAKRTVADLADWPYPSAAAGAVDRGRARPSQRRGLPRLHPGLPLLPGRDDHPARARATGRAGAGHGACAGSSGAATTRSR